MGDAPQCRAGSAGLRKLLPQVRTEISTSDSLLFLSEVDSGENGPGDEYHLDNSLNLLRALPFLHRTVTHVVPRGCCRKR